MPFRKNLAAKAHTHYDWVQKEYSISIKKSIEDSTVYSGFRDLPSQINPTRHVFLQPTDSVSCLFDNSMKGKVAILNFASYKRPGEFFLEGSTAQEEGLCHESTLYPVLRSKGLNSYYAWNNQNKNRGLYLDRAIYTPDIFFFHEGKIAKADVITCAAPNYTTANKYYNVSMEENLEVFRKRIAFLNNIARVNGVTTLIAGAWGCGVFGQPPEETCGLLLDELHIENLYLPIPPGRNFDAFDKVLKERALNG